MNSPAELTAAIIDMDGVLWEGNRPLPGLAEFFQALRKRRVRFVLATNNASRTPQQYVDKLAGFGVTVTLDEIITSALATAAYLTERRNGAQSPTRVYAIGDDGLQVALQDAGCDLLGLYETGAEYVICGMDKGLSWDKLATATLNIRGGATFIGTNPDTTLPSEHGLTHGNGAILAALQTATGVAPLVIGKPEPIMYQQALARLGTDPARTVAIGDRLGTDILGAVRAGIPSLLVLTGISRREDLAGLDYAPTWVLPSIVELTSILESGDSGN